MEMVQAAMAPVVPREVAVTIVRASKATAEGVPASMQVMAVAVAG